MQHDIPIHLIVLLPLLGSIVNGLFGKRWSEGVIAGIACTAVFLPFLIALQAFWHLFTLPEGAEHVIRQAPLFSWISSGDFQVPLSFTIDPLTSVFTLVITGVGFLIHMYSSGYMHDDPGFYKFYAYLNLFMFSMLMLVMGSNLLLMFVGWEGVGVCSYLLIGYYYDDHANADAGKKAFITNRVGDFGFLLGIFFILFALHSQGIGMTLDFAHLRELAPHLGGYATIIGLLLFVGAAGKSAQIPLYVWLPDAMAGPTPVSALIHAATMVTAGVYMVARMSFIYAQSPVAMTVVASVGALTALFAATIGLVQNDIKKVLAYSTVSQLGYMFMGVGVGAFTAGLFHVVTHAFFKACLFLGAGSVIHALHHEQDIRNMGGLFKKMPRTAWTFLISTAAIAGMPGLSGFFSKDEILWKAFSNQNTLIPGWVFWLVGVVAAMCTAFYMVRLFCLTFLGEYRGGHGHDHGKPGHEDHDHGHDHGAHAAGHTGHGHHHGPQAIHESPYAMTIPLIILGALALVGGYLGMPHWLGAPNAFEHWLEPVFEGVATSRVHFAENTPLELGLMAVSVALAGLAAFTAYRFYAGRSREVPAKLAAQFAGAHRVLLGKYFVDELYKKAIVEPTKALAGFCWRVIDDGLIDGVLVNGTAKVVGLFGSGVCALSTGNVQTYAGVLFVGLWALVVIWLAG